MLKGLDQERIVLFIAIGFFIVFSVGLNGFLSADNVLSLV